MKLSLTPVFFCALAVLAQEYPPDQLKNLSIPTSTSVRPVSVRAQSIERGPNYPSVVHLKGAVEIRTPVCTGSPARQTCDGYVVLHADEADFHEDSGAVEARGNVKMTREK